MRNRMLRRFGAFVAAGALAMSLMAAPAMAAGGTDGGSEPPGTVEPAAEGENIVVVRKAVPKAKYDLYKLLQLDAEIGEKDGAKAVVSYRYSYDTALKGIISDVVKLKDFKYDATRGYGFKVDGDVVVFIAPEDKGTEDGAVKAMAAAFADEMRSRIEGTEGMEPVASATAPDAGENLVVSFKNIPDGYWMVASNAGARSIVFTTPGKDGSKTMEVKEKNPAPHVTKEVWDKDDYAAGGSWRGSNDAAFGDEMDFRITVELYNGSENIRIHDEMCEGLTFGKIKNVIFYPRTGSETYGREVYLLDGGEGGKRDTTSKLDLTDDWRVYTEEAGDHGFVLTFKNSFVNPASGEDNRDPADMKNNAFLGDLSKLEDDGGRIEIVYTATLNKDAVVGAGPQLDCGETDEAHEHGNGCYVDGNVNKSYVQYGHIRGVDPGKEPGTDAKRPGETPKEETRTYTYRFAIDKFVSGSTETKLPGAEFEIRKDYVGISGTGSEDSENAWIDGENLILPEGLYDISASVPMSLVDITPKDKDYTGGKVYRVAVDVDAATVKTVVTNESGLITIEGLDSNLYSITEITAPAGYNPLAAPVMTAVGSAFSGHAGTMFEEDPDATRGEGEPYVFVKEADTTVGIANSSGFVMPDTGGIGTTIFYVAGAVLILGAGALLIVKKRSDRTGD